MWEGVWEWGVCEGRIIDFDVDPVHFSTVICFLGAKSRLSGIGVWYLAACKREGLKTLQAKPSSSDWLIPPSGATAGEFGRVFGY